ncbi:hypothetical protein NST07_25900 [Paenibacillus sp. FSL L8-0340]|uniref:hypothetical protein n=1 Tax=Paenibacillus sp. FSL L8-0340 TaxID=2954685 RepID=UPI0031597220
MAKLNVTYPAVDVMVNGQAYRKVDRKAQAGDIVKALRDHMDIAEGAFYAVYADRDGDPVFKDDGGDERFVFLDHRDRYETFAPVSTPTPDETATTTFDGAQYRKVDRSAREGDVIVFTEAPRSYLTSGKAYVVDEIDFVGDAQITDDDGDDLDTAGLDFDVYEKVTEEAAQIIATPTVEYREVKRWAEKGERIRIINLHPNERHYEQGAEFTVNDVDGDGDVRVTAGELNRKLVVLSEYVVLEPLATAQPAKYSAGDYVKVTGNSVHHDYAEGSVVKITETQDNVYYGGQQFRAETADGKRGNWLVTNDVKPADEAAFEAAKAELQKPKPARLTVGDYAKVIGPNDNDNDYEIGTVVQIAEDWTRGHITFTRARKADGQLGNYIRDYQLEPATEAEFWEQRSPAEPERLTVGDYAKIATKEGGFLSGIVVGDVVQVVENPHEPDDRHFRVRNFNGRTGYADKKRGLTPATPEEVAQAQRKIAVGPFADGGFAQIVNANADNASPTAIQHPNAYVKVAVEPAGRVRALKLLDVSGGCTGYANADALRQITEAEYNAATQPKDPRDDFAKGDKVRLISGGETGGLCDYETGNVYTVLSPKSPHGNGKVQITGGGQPTGYALPEQLVKLTAEEAQEIAKWSAIGRKVGEFKRGDIVEAKRVMGGGDWIYGRVEDGPTPQGDDNYIGMGLRLHDGAYRAVTAEGAALIVPVEQRFDAQSAA